MLVTVLAWLPGTDDFVVETEDGIVGHSNGSKFDPMGPNFFHSATLKYGYRKLIPNVVDLANLPRYAETL